MVAYHLAKVDARVRFPLPAPIDTYKMIIVIGDSWGVGEWSSECHLSGPGFAQYMALHSEVFNLSVGAASNTLCLDRLESLFSRLKLCRTDTVYWVVTCPTRCITIKDLLDADSLQSVIDMSLQKALSRANVLAANADVTINLIGGLCDLDYVDFKPYPNLHAAVPSWCKLLDADYPSFPAYSNYWCELGERLSDTENDDRMRQWIDIADKFLAKEKSWHNMQLTFFGTDGGHPDRRAHLLLRNYLYPEWQYKF